MRQFTVELCQMMIAFNLLAISEAELIDTPIQKKYPTLTPLCKLKEYKFYLNRAGTSWACQCLPGFIRGPEDTSGNDECFLTRTKGPCENGHSIHFNLNTKKSECILDSCSDKGLFWMPALKTCKSLGDPCSGLLPGLVDKRLRVGLIHKTLQPECVIDEPWSLSDLPNQVKCKKGFWGDKYGNCRNLHDQKTPAIPKEKSFSFLNVLVHAIYANSPTGYVVTNLWDKLGGENYIEVTKDDLKTANDNSEDQKPCMPNEYKFNLNRKESRWGCQCIPGFLYHKPTDKCYFTHSLGPCPDGNSFIFDMYQRISRCIPDKNNCVNYGTFYTPTLGNCKSIGDECTGLFGDVAEDYHVGIDLKTLIPDCVKDNLPWNLTDLPNQMKCEKGFWGNKHGECLELDDVPTPMYIDGVNYFPVLDPK